MRIKIYLIARNKSYDATAVYEDGKTIVEKGSKLRMSFANHVRGGQTAKRYRKDSSFVNEDGITIKDCEFSSPSTAAQFVTGVSVNGWVAWHVDKKTTLKQYVESHKKENREND